MEWFERAEAAERAEDWETAIALVGARAACWSADHHAHGLHLRHLDLLARAGRFEELGALARSDVHARRRLDRALGEQGAESALRGRAGDGDRYALYVLVRLLLAAGRGAETRQVVEEVGPDDPYARQLLGGSGGSDGAGQG